MTPLALPAGACDCHTHVFGTAPRYPFDPDRGYTPAAVTPAALLAQQRALGLDRVVLVQPSPHGADNACLADALAALGAMRARGVAVIDAATTEAELDRLHALGVRGVRINLHTAGRADPGQARALLAAAAARVAPRGWHVQVYTDLAVIAALEAAITALPCPLVVDHFGRSMGAGGLAQPGLDALLRLLGQGVVHVKLSAAHRLSAQPGLADMAPIARAMIAANPDRVLWGSDWPHAGIRPGLPPDAIHPFNAIDDAAALQRLAGWAGDAAMLARILVANPARLYGFPQAG